MNINIAILYTIIFSLIVFVINFVSSYSCLTFHFDCGTFYILAGLVELLLTILFVHVIMKMNIFSLPQKTNYKWYFISVIFGILFVLFQPILVWLYYLFTDIDYSITYTLFDNIEFSILSISTILLIPISEELYFRQFLQNRLHKKYRPFFAILITSILFAMIHAPIDAYLGNYFDLNFGEIIVPSWKGVFIAFWGSLIIGGLFYKSNSIGSAILMHITWNLAVKIL